MKFFNSNKLKLRSEVVEDGVKFYIDYNKYNESSNFKLNLFRELMGNNPCLGIIDTKLLYKSNTISKIEITDQLEALLNKFSIKYKKVTSRNTASTSILGLTIQMNEKKKANDYIMGFVITGENIENMGSIMDSYNAHYYILDSKMDEDELLNEVNNDYEEQKFIYDIYIDNFVRNLAVYSRNKDSHIVSDIVDKVNNINK